MYNNFCFYNPVRLYFGVDAVDELATMELPGKKALIVTTPEKFFVDRVAALLKKNGVDSVGFHEVRPNPSTTGVAKAAQMALDNGCDFLVAIGGGSAIDTAKNAAIIMKNGEDIWEFMGGKKSPEKGAAPIVAIATTAGTGSEADQGAVVTRDDTMMKMDVFDECIYPTISIVDAGLMASVPPGLTACQGMDVLFHSTEGFIGKYSNPMGDMYAKESIRLASDNLPRAYRHGDDLEARANVALACTLAGVNESQTCTASLHAIAHAFGSMHNKTPHGIALCLVAEECFKFYIKNVPEKFAELSELVGYGRRAEGYVEWLIDMMKKVDLYNIDYTKFGIDPARAEEYAAKAFEATASYIECDVVPPTMEEMVGIIKRSLAR